MDESPMPMQIDFHPTVAELLEFWKEQRSDAVLPSIKSIDPIKLKSWIGQLSVIDLEPETRRLRCRLHGGDTQMHTGNSMKGKYFDDEANQSLEFIQFPYFEAEKYRLPVHSVYQPNETDNLSRFSKLERLIMPFCADGADINCHTVDRFLTWIGPTGYDCSAGSIFDSIESSCITIESIWERTQFTVIDKVPLVLHPKPTNLTGRWARQFSFASA